MYKKYLLNSCNIMNTGIQNVVLRHCKPLEHFLLSLQFSMSQRQISIPQTPKPHQCALW